MQMPRINNAEHPAPNDLYPLLTVYEKNRDKIKDCDPSKFWQPLPSLIPSIQTNHARASRCGDLHSGQKKCPAIANLMTAKML